MGLDFFPLKHIDILLYLYTTNMFSSWSDMVLNVTGTLKIDTISIEEVCEQR